MNSLLPKNATVFERNLATACAAIDDIPIPLRPIGDAAECPVDLLPFLAWQKSVDRWEPAWPEATKRAVIAASFFVHQRKGTIGAIRRAVEPLGYLIRVIEWFQTQPEGPRGTFKLDIGVLETGITDETYQELERLIDDAKPLTRHLTGLSISMESRGSFGLAGAVLLGEELTVYPYTPEEINVSGSGYYAGATHIVDTLTVSQ